MAAATARDLRAQARAEEIWVAAEGEGVEGWKEGGGFWREREMERLFTVLGGAISGGGSFGGEGEDKRENGKRSLTEDDGMAVCGGEEGESMEVEGGSEVVLVLGFVVVCQSCVGRVRRFVVRTGDDEGKRYILTPRPFLHCSSRGLLLLLRPHRPSAFAPLTLFPPPRLDFSPLIPVPLYIRSRTARRA